MAAVSCVDDECETLGRSRHERPPHTQQDHKEGKLLYHTRCKITDKIAKLIHCKRFLSFIKCISTPAPSQSAPMGGLRLMIRRSMDVISGHSSSSAWATLPAAFFYQGDRAGKYLSRALIDRRIVERVANVVRGYRAGEVVAYPQVDTEVVAYHLFLLHHPDGAVELQVVDENKGFHRAHHPHRLAPQFVHNRHPS